jgi:uncharacterized protein YjbI with pentapeptide repeats
VIIQKLAEFIRAKSVAGSNDQPINAVIQSALNVLRNRNPADDGNVEINLSNTNLTNANLSGINLSGATLADIDLSNANLSDANLRGANLNYAFFGGANLAGTTLEGANLTGASFYQTTMCHGARSTQPQRNYDCKR